MPDELTRFQTTGPSWAERAAYGELQAVLSPVASSRRNAFLDSVHQFAAHTVLKLAPHRGVLVDFGCGTGRFLRYFGKHGFSVVGTEITPEMLAQARNFGVPHDAKLIRTNGITIPLANSSVDVVWCCAVLRYSLFVASPVYRDIAQEMYRVLKPGGAVVNVEMYVDQPPQVFCRDFEAVGFATKQVRVLTRHNGRMESLSQSRRMPLLCVPTAGKITAALRSWFDNPVRANTGLRDYLFVWHKSDDRMQSQS